MKRIVFSVLALALVVTLTGATVTEAPSATERSIVDIAFDSAGADSFGDWLQKNSSEIGVCESTDSDGSFMDLQKRGGGGGGGGSCGGNTCGWFQYCCNASCGICVPFGWSCTQQACDSDI